jgi:hypothetical protein
MPAGAALVFSPSVNSCAYPPQIVPPAATFTLSVYQALRFFS